MAFELPDLPFGPTDLEPFLSAETLDYHHGKHHKAYVDNLNKLTAGTTFEGVTLEELIKTADGGVFNNAAQVWNHSFYWNCLSPAGGGEPTAALAKAIDADFGGFAAFRDRFSEAAGSNFGSGWTWLVKNSDGTLEIVNTSNAGNPMTDGKRPLLTCDVWEHAYYIDYRNARPKYIDSFWQLANWDQIAKHL